MEAKKHLQTLGQWSLVILVIIVLVGLYVQIGGTDIPSNALVYLDHQSKTYFGPSCVRDAQKLAQSTIAEARERSYEPDAECRDQGSFAPTSYSLLHFTLIKAGFLDPKPSKWNADGSWNSF